ncbi:hypothetical protein [Janthinobacterium sp. 1_2014MBL_MicDiv]|uniref:hypothetical protein n=1 Tax=Janthinobacterium sp. 1_2014MBL_MicDiv TaxID=1644131 RepID=UPI0008F52881|nr:hypothetical protein [Janthinobacterium sp. 1_2014MBL_MicDiv]APA68813.1 hypothetical protein YQ44_14520 [Janthinobacterium sp. 1_2014MBL_MicDiv]
MNTESRSMPSSSSAHTAATHRSAVPSSRCDETIGTLVWMEEFHQLDQLFNHQHNYSPKMRHPDLISACIARVFAQPEPAKHIFSFLHTRMVLRDQCMPRRQEEIWRAQYVLLLALQKSEMNRHPHPRFDLGQFTTACISLALQEDEAQVKIFEQARRNIAERAISHLP